MVSDIETPERLTARLRMMSERGHSGAEDVVRARDEQLRADELERVLARFEALAQTYEDSSEANVLEAKRWGDKGRADMFNAHMQIAGNCGAFAYKLRTLTAELAAERQAHAACRDAVASLRNTPDEWRCLVARPGESTYECCATRPCAVCVARTQLAEARARIAAVEAVATDWERECASLPADDAIAGQFASELRAALQSPDPAPGEGRKYLGNGRYEDD